MNKIVLRIADLRKKAKVTQQELAERIGVYILTPHFKRSASGKPESICRI